MKKLVKALIISTALVLVTVQTACGIPGKYENSNQKFNQGGASSSTQDGRYVETEWLAGRDMIDSILPRMTPQGDVALLISTADEWDNDPRQIQGLHEKDMRMFISNDGSSWSESSNPFTELHGKTGVLDITYDNNNLYFLFFKQWNMAVSFHVGVIKNGVFSELPINLDEYPPVIMNYDIFTGKTSGDYTEIKNLSSEHFRDFIVKNGVIYVSRRGPVKAFREDGSLVKTYGDNNSAFTVTRDEIIAAGIDGKAIRIYEKETGVLIKEYSSGKMVEIFGLCSDAQGNVYSVSKTGIYKRMVGNETWEQIVDGSHTSLADEAISFSRIEILSDGSFLVSGGDTLSYGGGQARIFRYCFDQNVSAEREKSISVVALYPNTCLTSAILEFERKFPDTTVEVEILTETNPGLFETDIINALNTKIMMGDGPDILCLDGLPHNSYMENNLLMDISGTLQEIKSENVYFENILNTWQRNDKIFAVPLVFQLPAVNTFEIPGGDIDVKLYQSSDTIDYSKLEPSRFYAFDDDYIIPDECAIYPASASVSINDIVDWGKQNPDKRAIFNLSKEQIARDLFLSAYPQFYENSGFNKEKFINFLYDVDQLSMNPIQPVLQKAQISERMGWASISIPIIDDSYRIEKHIAASKNETFFNIQYLHGFVDLMLMDGNTYDMQMVKNSEFDAYDPDNYLDPREAFHLFGDTYRPICNLGIVKSSTKTEIAELFIKTALQKEVQDKFFVEGFPIMRSCYQRNLWYLVNESIIIVDNGEQQELNNTWPLPLMMKLFTNAVSTLDKPVCISDNMQSEILALCQNYFDGEKEAAQVALEVESLIKRSGD